MTISIASGGWSSCSVGWDVSTALVHQRCRLTTPLVAGFQRTRMLGATH